MLIKKSLQNVMFWHVYNTDVKPVVTTLYLSGVLDEGTFRPKHVGNDIENKRRKYLYRSNPLKYRGDVPLIIVLSLYTVRKE